MKRLFLRYAAILPVLWYCLFGLPVLAQVGTQHGVLVSASPSTSTGVTGYQVYRVTGTGVPGPSQLITTAPIATPQYLDPAAGLTTGATYTYYMTAVIVVGGVVTQESGISNGATITGVTFPVGPTPPTGCTASVR